MNTLIRSIFLSLLTISTLHSGSEPNNQGNAASIGMAMMAAALGLGYYTYTLVSEDLSHENEYRRIRKEIEQVPGVRIKDRYYFLSSYDSNYNKVYRRYERFPKLKLENVAASERAAIIDKWYDEAFEQYKLGDKNSWKSAGSLLGTLLLGYLGYQLYTAPPGNK